ncbi:transposase [Cereibacter sphaeroides]|uniref:RNA-guided endonuclease InsQ/TnpB family protein n=1 Tax=Cereibacter sphaeroides TaxID=1063 RepID=UPI001F229C3A|nr:transposase [Cereibacter sphaeroides]MCE6958327.1 transposase [Cereibacter sphaeroides]
MHRTLSTRIRLNPDLDQEVEFRRIAGSCRLVYNLGLEQRRDFWRQYRATEGRHLHWMGQKKELPALKEAAPFLADAPAHCLQMALQDLQRAFDAFFAGRAGYPRPRKKFENDSFRFPDPAQIRIDAKAGLLILPKFGRSKGDHGAIRAVFHRPIRGKIRSVTIVREGRHWYASILLQVRCKVPAEKAPVSIDEVYGVDRGVEVPFMGSDGVARGHAILPKPGSGEAKRRKRLEQALARAKKGSKRRAKVRLKLAAHRAREARRRKDMIEKVTTEIANNHRVVVIENLPVRSMTASARGTVEDPGANVAQKAGLNTVILDKGWGLFRIRLEQKLAARGGLLIVVSAAFTSQICACCGHVSAESRLTRDLFRCTACGHEAHADHNAACNIRDRGLALLGLAPSARIERPAAGAVVAVC